MTLLSIINFVLNLPTAINYEKEPRLSTEPPKMEVHQRNLPLTFVCLLAASAIGLFMINHERQHRTLQLASRSTDAWFSDLSKFIYESNTTWFDPLIAFFVKVFGWALSFGVFWALPASVFLVLVLRAGLEAVPGVKNDVAQLIAPKTKK